MPEKALMPEGPVRDLLRRLPVVNIEAPDFARARPLYGLLADEVEFSQFDLDRQHIRLRYRRSKRDWIRDRLRS